MSISYQKCPGFLAFSKYLNNLFQITPAKKLKFRLPACPNISPGRPRKGQEVAKVNRFEKSSDLTIEMASNTATTSP